MFTFDGFVGASPFMRRGFFTEKIAPENPERNNATVEKEESEFSLDDSILKR